MRNPPPRCQSRVADGARLTDRPQGTGRPFGLRTPPAVELTASPMPNAGQKKSAGIEDGGWCALWFQAVKPGCGICRSGSMVCSIFRPVNQTFPLSTLSMSRLWARTVRTIGWTRSVKDLRQKWAPSSRSSGSNDLARELYPLEATHGRR